MDKTQKIKVTNRSNGSVILKIPEMNIRREFYKKETKNIPYEQLEAIASQPGGRELIYNYLYIEDEKVIRELLNIKEEPEYWLTEDKVPTWMNTCSLNEFIDALNFAPQGIKDIIKKLAVSLPLNDVAKREAIKTQLHFDVTKAIENSKEEEEIKEEQPKRIAETTSTNRLSATPTYARKVITKES